MSADALLHLIRPHHHGQSIPTHQALNSTLHFLAAGKWRLLAGSDRVLVRRSRRKRQVNPGLAPRV